MENLGEFEFPPLNEMSPLTLAFLGDCVYELLVRQFLVSGGSRPVKKLHSEAVEWVRCEAQAAALREVLWPMLTDEEKAVVTRGRNAHVGHVPKNAGVADYHEATGLEALFGWLYIKRSGKRLSQLFHAIAERK